MQYGPQSALDGARVVGGMLLVGAAMGVFYDVFRVLRRFFRFGYSVIFAQDILFFCVSAVVVFFAATKMSGGRMRAAYALSALAGWLLYALSAGVPVMFLADGAAALMRSVKRGAWRLLDRRILSAKKIKID